MGHPHSLADRLFRRNARSRLSRRKSSARRRTSQLPPVAAEIALLEPRCLLSTAALGSETLVNTGALGLQRLSDDGGNSIDVTPAGTVISVWSTFDAGGSRIVGRRIASDGTLLGTDFPISTTVGGIRDNAVVSAFGEDRFVVAWESHGNAQDPSGLGVFARVFAGNGVPLTGEIRINASILGNQVDPSVAWLSPTRFVVAWSGAGQGDAQGVLARVFDISGVPVSREIHVPQTVAGVQQHAVVVGLPNGNFQVAWSGTVHGILSGIFTRQFNSAGLPVTPQLLVNTSKVVVDQQPAIATDGSSQMIIAWQSVGDPLDRSGAGIIARHVLLNGLPVGNEFLVNQTTQGLQFDPSVSFLSDKSFVVTWRGTGAGDSDGVYAREFYPVGIPKGPERLVNTARSGVQEDPTVRAQGAGGYVVAWDGNVGGLGTAGGGSTPQTVSPRDNQGIAMQRFGDSNILQFAGYGWSTDYRFNLAGTGWFSSGQQWAPQNAFVAADGLHLKLAVATVSGGGQNYTALSSAEVDLTQDSAGNPFHPGFGTYLVAAHHDGGFNLLGNNKTVAFGAFTYQKNADPNTTNTYHELDMIEASRFGPPNPSDPPNNGWQGDPSNAQFTVQPWQYFTQGTHDNPNVHRITLQDSGDITLVMHWVGANQPVVFDVYYGIYTLDTLPASPDITWTTFNGTNGNVNQNPLIPPNGDQTVHLNLWREPQIQSNPDQPTDEVIVKNFQYRP